MPLPAPLPAPEVPDALPHDPAPPDLPPHDLPPHDPGTRPLDMRTFESVLASTAVLHEASARDWHPGVRVIVIGGSAATTP